MIFIYCRFGLADGAKEITKAMLEVFGIETKRLMCWSHKYRAYKDHGSNKKLVRVNRNLAEELDKDIGQLQWMVSSETEFCLVYDLIEKKV